MLYEYRNVEKTITAKKLVDHNNYFRSTVKKTTPKEDNSNMSTYLRIRVMVFIATFNNNSVIS